MANIDINKKLTLSEADMNQVKGGPLTAYLKIDDIQGESTRDHKEWIDVLSVSYTR